MAALFDMFCGLNGRTSMPRADAALAADVLVMADLRGVDSHGVSNMLKSYLDRYQDGSQNPRPATRHRPHAWTRSSVARSWS